MTTKKTDPIAGDAKKTAAKNAHPVDNAPGPIEPAVQADAPISQASIGRVGDDWEVPKGAEGQFHVEVEKVEFSTEDGTKISRPAVIVLPVREFKKDGEKRLASLGYTYTKVLHDPTV